MGRPDPKALSCGLFHGGRQQVDGVEAIRLLATANEVQRQQGAHEVLWVNPKTFLPVRMSFGPGSAMPGAARADFRWLPPTEATWQAAGNHPDAMAAHRLPAGTGILFWQVIYIGPPGN